MPSQLTVSLEGGSPERVRPLHVYGLVVRWAEPPADPATHHDSLKPYAVTPLFEGPGGSAQFRVGILDEDLAEVVAKEASRNEVVRLGSQTFEVASVDVFRESWGEFAGSASARERYRFVFRTPVIFRSGNVSNPLPLPGLVFGHLRRRWQQFAPPQLGMTLDLQRFDLPVTHMEVGTVGVRFKDSNFVGVLGEVEYRARGASPGERMMLHSLGRLAQYAGVGSFTTNGFGVTEFRLAREAGQTANIVWDA